MFEILKLTILRPRTNMEAITKQEKIWLIIVAISAPDIPNLRLNIKIGSKNRLRIPPDVMPIIAKPPTDKTS